MKALAPKRPNDQALYDADERAATVDLTDEAQALEEAVGWLEEVADGTYE